MGRYMGYIGMYKVAYDTNLNSGTPIFKIRILAHFVSHDFLK